jgi:hypothetical protein
METNKNEFYVVSVEDTIKYGIIKAAIIGRIRHWCQYNEKNNVQDRHHINFWWSGFMSSKVFAEQLGIKQKTIEDNISILLKNGVIIKGCFNKKNYDRTGWYRINPNPPIKETLSPNSGNGFTEIQETLSRNTGNGYTEIQEMDLLNNGTPIPVSISVNHSVKNSVSTSVNPPVNPSVEEKVKNQYQFKYIQYDKLKAEYQFEYKTKLQKEELTYGELQEYIDEEEEFYKLTNNLNNK